MPTLRHSLSCTTVHAGELCSVTTRYAARCPGPNTVQFSTVVLKLVSWYVTLSGCSAGALRVAGAEGSAPKIEGASPPCCHWP